MINILGIKKNREYSKKTRQKALEKGKLKLRYRTHMIDSFNIDPLKCRCGSYMSYTCTFNSLEGKKNDEVYRRECINEMWKLRLRRERSILGVR